jgi:hypothetical protein
MKAPVPSWGSRLSREPKPDPISAKTRALVRKRAGGVCELCTISATHLHHRQLRRGGNHGAGNLLLLCFLCHRRVHSHVAEAEIAGWLVSQYADPGEQPVALGGRWWLLSDDGRKTETTTAA